MSLLKLLATGRSLVGMRETTSRYQMRAANLLPKFGSPKNPFATQAKAEPAPVAPAPKPAAAPTPAKPEPAKMETAPLFEPKPGNTAAPAAATVQPVVKDVSMPATAKVVKTQPATIQAGKVEPGPASPARVPSAKRESSGGWIQKLNPLGYFSSGAAGAGKARAARTPVQTELSLEKVKVVRNELNDDDLKVRPAPTAQMPGAASAVLPQPGGAGATAWGRLTSRVLGTDQTLVN
jgi:hypothetical protein